MANFGKYCGGLLADLILAGLMVWGLDSLSLALGGLFESFWTLAGAVIATGLLALVPAWYWLRTKGGYAPLAAGDRRALIWPAALLFLVLGLPALYFLSLQVALKGYAPVTTIVLGLPFVIWLLGYSLLASFVGRGDPELAASGLYDSGAVGRR